MSEPKIIVFDLETLPNLTAALEHWPQLSAYPGLTFRASINSIICAGWKQYGSESLNCINAWEFPAWDSDVNDDRAVCLALYAVLKDADAVVTQNGKGFDWKFFQTRLFAHGLAPLGKIPHIDVKQIAKQNLFVFNNRLGTLGKFLVGDDKMKHEGWELWSATHRREAWAMEKMTAYCKQDVALLEKLFIKLKPLIPNVPNHNHFREHEKQACPTCGSTRLQGNGWRHTATRSYRRYQCLDCHSWLRTDITDRNPRTL